MYVRRGEIDRVPRYYYHISQEKFGNLTLVPRNYGRHRAPGEPDIARICVSTSLSGCIVAMPLYRQTTYAYKTVHKEVAMKPYQICDMEVTGEMWLVNKTEFELIYIFTGEIVHQIYAIEPSMVGCTEYIEVQMDAKERIKKLLKSMGIPDKPTKPLIL